MDLALNNLQSWYAIKPKQPTNHICLVYMNKPDLALNNQQRLICHKTKSNQNLHYLNEVIIC